MMKKHLWTKSEIKKLIDMWETKTTEEIAKEIKIKLSQVVYMASRIRQENPLVIENKMRRGITSNLIKEVLKEL